MTILKQIAEQVENSQRFLVVAHENPDGDAIGSSLGLALALRGMGKDVVLYNSDPVPDMLAFLPQSELFCQDLPAAAAFDVAFVLDAGDIGRTGLPVTELATTVINIDHHPHSTFGDLCYLDVDACATAVLIYRLLRELGYPIDLAIAKALYLGILSDTGSFRYSSANDEAFRVSAELVALGIDPWEMASQLYESYAPERMKLLGLVLPSLDISPCGRYASLSMTRDQLLKSGAEAEHADGFVNYPRAIRGVEVACFYRQLDDDRYKISFRSRGRIDVGELSRRLGGGGHHNAAGATLTAPLSDLKATVCAELDQLFSTFS